MVFDLLQFGLYFSYINSSVHMALNISVFKLLRKNCSFTLKLNNFSTVTTACLSKSVIWDQGERLEIQGASWPYPLHIPFTWLRDHCRCQLCYSAKTNQRLFNVASMPLSIKPSAANIDDEQLKVVWPDGHESEYSFKFLWQNILAGGVTASMLKFIRHPWNARSFPSLKKISTSLKSVEAGPGRIKFFGCLEKYGLCIIDQVDHDVESTEKAVRSVAPVYKTFFGDMWCFSDDLAMQDSAYTNEALGVHNDTTYFTQAARLQVFHCLKVAEEGGETLLVDGMNVAIKLKEKHLDAFKFFSTKPLSGEYVGDGEHHLSTHTVFREHPVTGAFEQIRYNLYDRAPVSSLDTQGLHDYYRHLNHLAAVVNNPVNEVKIQLVPGSVLFLDNWRVMHGRAAFTGSRTMTGCYVSNEDYTSKARLLGYH